MPRESVARQPLCADIGGFSLHAAVRCEAHERERLAALVPRPRLHLIRFRGVLAPNAKLRSSPFDCNHAAKQFDSSSTSPKVIEQPNSMLS